MSICKMERLILVQLKTLFLKSWLSDCHVHEKKFLNIHYSDIWHLVFKFFNTSSWKPKQYEFYMNYD